MLSQYTLTSSKYVLIILSAAILIRCIRSMLSERYEPEVWAHLRSGRESVPVCHWENVIGRAASSDIRIRSRAVSRVHAVLKRSDRGVWRIYDIFSKGGVWVNGVKIGEHGAVIHTGDIINIGGERLRFVDITTAKHQRLEEGRTSAGKSVSPYVTLFELTVFEAFLLLQHVISADKDDLGIIALGFLVLAALQWCCYYAMRIMNRSGFEVETIAFYLTALGLSVAAGSSADDMIKQILLTVTAVFLFFLNGWWLRRLKRVTATRTLAAVGAALLMLVNVVVSDAVLGARNWLTFAGISFQPSELVKVAYIYVGAATMDRLFSRRNLFMFIAFSAFCVVSLALIGDFGTALVFFVTFLVISFMRSGSLATVMLAVTGAGLAGFLAIRIKPYIASRFSIWGHAWEDVYNRGFQQTRAMSAAASGGLWGKGAGSGWLKDIFAANTDMVFALICEELGLVIAVIMVLAVIVLAFFTVRSARHGRSAYYSIAACAAMSMLLTQVGLNVFGSVDLLPFTGITFPFVSKGGTSLLSCWMLMSFIKSADNRKDASFAVQNVDTIQESDEYLRTLEWARELDREDELYDGGFEQ